MKNGLRSCFLIVCFFAIAFANTIQAQTRVLLIASSTDYGYGPYTSTIEDPLIAAGYQVRVWNEGTSDWPPLDTLWEYDVVFFHNSERRGIRPADTLLTDFVEAGGRLVLEGSDITQVSCVYHDFAKYVFHAKWRGTDLSNFTHTVIDTFHPLVQGVPASFTASGYCTRPDLAEPFQGGHSVILYENTPTSSALISYPRLAFFCGSIYRINSEAVRDSLVVNSVRWVLMDPTDAGVYDLDYELGHRSGESIPVTVTMRSWAPDSLDGQLLLEVSADSANWTAVDSIACELAPYEMKDYILSWTPSVPDLYYLRAEIRPLETDEQEENNSMGLLVTTLQEVTHPRMFFTAADIPTLLTQAQTTHAEIAQAIENKVLGDMDDVYPPPEEWASVDFRVPARALSNAALQAVLDPSPTFVDYAKSRALELCRYPHWDNPGRNVDTDVDAGRACVALAMAYDWLYDEFSPAERDTVQHKLVTQLERLESAFSRYIWWAEAFIHAHQWCSVNYMGTATYGLLEEEPYATQWRNRAFENFNQRMELYGPVDDGSWYESMSYWTYITFGTLPYLYLLREQEGIDYFDIPFVKNRAKFRLYASLPRIERMISYNECNHYWGFGPDAQLSLLAREYRDSTAQWLRSQIISYAGHNLTDPLDFFFYDPTVPEVPPTMLSYIAPDQDSYFGRNDWSRSSMFVSLKCGLPAGRNAYMTFWFENRIGEFAHSHFHPDAGAITIHYGEQYFVHTPGAQYPKSFTRNSPTILVNGQPQIGDSTKGGGWPGDAYASHYYPHLADTFESKTVDYVIGDATRAYYPYVGLTQFERHLLFIRPKMIVMVDRLKATSPSTFTFLLCNFQNIYSWDTQRIYMTIGDAQLSMRVLEPEQWTASTSFNWVYYESQGMWRLSLDNIIPDTSLRYLTVFYPPEGGEPSVTRLASGDTLSAVRLVDVEGFEAVAAIRYEEVDSITVDSLRTDAQLAVVLRDTVSEQITGITVKRSRFLRWGEEFPLRYWSPDTLNLTWEYHGDTLAVYGTPIDSVHIWAPNATVVLVNDMPYVFIRAGDFVILGIQQAFPPLPVNDLTIIAYVPDSIELRWTAVTRDVEDNFIQPDAYFIYKSDSFEALQYYAQVPAPDTTFVDSIATSENSPVFYEVTVYIEGRLTPFKPRHSIDDKILPRTKTVDAREIKMRRPKREEFYRR